MTDKAKENLNIEVGASWWTKEKTDYTKILEWKKKNTLWDDEAAEAAKKAEKLLEQIQTTPWDTKKEKPRDNTTKLPSDIPQEIQDLKRPEAQEWLQKSYQAIQDDIDDMTHIWMNITNFFGFWQTKEKTH
jgi:hypothetical protein